MTTTAEWLKVDAERMPEVLQDCDSKLDASAGEVLLDFSAVRRVDPAALQALDRLLIRASEKGLPVILRAVNVEIYKVIKLAKLAPRVSFAN